MKNKIIASLIVFGLSMQCMLATILPGAQTHEEIIGKLSKSTKTTGRLESLMSNFQKQCENSKSTSCDLIQAFECYLQRLHQGLQDGLNDPEKEA